MLLEILYRNLTSILVFFTLAGVTWIYGGTRPVPLYETLPWLMAFTLEGLLFFPQRRAYEDMVQARERVWNALRCDPLLYVVLAFLVMLFIPVFNRGLCPNCDCQAIAGGADPKPLPFLPFCVNLADHLSVLTWFVPAFLAALSVRHALTREGKRILLEMIVWNGVVLALFGFIEQATDARFVFWEKTEHPVYFFSVFGYPNAAGSFFTMVFAFSIGLWRYHAKEVDFLRRANEDRRTVGPSYYWLRAHYPLAAVVLILFAVLYTRSRAAILLTASLSAMACVYVVLEALGPGIARARRLKTIAFSTVGMVIIGIAISVFSPNEISVEMKTADLAAIADRVTGKTEWHADAAFTLFKEHPIFGIGGWGYKHLCLPYVPPAARRSFGLWWSRGGANVHNDHLQFLCEHGVAGLLLLLSMLALMVWPICVVWNRLYMASRFVRGDTAPSRPRAIFVLPAAAFWVLAGCICVMIHAFGDCPLRGAAVLTTMFAALPAAEGFIPHKDEIELATDGASKATQQGHGHHHR